MIKMILSNANLFVFVDNLYKNDLCQIAKLDFKCILTSSFNLRYNLYIYLSLVRRFDLLY